MHEEWSFGLAGVLLLASAGAAAGGDLQCLAPQRSAEAEDAETDGIYEIVATEDKGWLVGAEKGLFKLDAAGRLAPVAVAGGGDMPGFAIPIVSKGDGSWLIGTSEGPFHFDAAGPLEPIPNGSQAGTVESFYDAGRGVWLIDAENGLFRLDASGLTLLLGSDGWHEVLDTGNGAQLIKEAVAGKLYWHDVTGFEALPVAEDLKFDLLSPFNSLSPIVSAGGDVWLIGTDTGLFRRDASGMVLIWPDTGTPTGEVTSIVAAGDGRWLIGAGNGLYRLEGTQLRELWFGSSVTAIEPDGSGAWWVGTSDGVHRFVGDSLGEPQLPDGGDATFVERITRAGDAAWLVDTTLGSSFWLDASGLTLLQLHNELKSTAGGEIGDARAIASLKDGAWLIGTDNGLYRFDQKGLSAPPLDSAEGIGETHQIVDAGNGAWLIRSDNGFFRYDESGLFPLRVKNGEEIGEVRQFVDAGNGGWLVATERGLFRLDPGSRPVVHAPATASDAPNDARHIFAWLLKHPCVGVLPDSGLIGVRFGGSPEWQTAVVQRPGADGRPDVVRVEVEHELDNERPGEVTASLGFRPTTQAEFQPLPGSETKVRVGWGPWDHAKDAFRRFGLWALAGQVLAFGALLLAARQRSWAWNVVTDPLWGKIGLWFWAGLRFVPGMQRWMLARWWDALGNWYPAADYLPMPLAGPNEAAMTSSERAAALAPGRRIWLQGAAGMGKTVLVDRVVADWCAAGDLGAAFAKWGYVPLPIALRDFAAVEVPAAPEEWLIDLAGRRLEAAGLRVEDGRLLRGMLTGGYWVLLLDGANEVDDKRRGAVQQFARRFPQVVGMLITSQDEPPADAEGLFEVWRLPADIGEATGPLLELYLGRERGAEVARRLAAAPIAGDIRSGYDVKLVAELVRGGTAPWGLPATRTELYDAMLAAAGSGYPVAELCRVAWEAWVAGRRDLKEGELAPEVIEPLKRPGVRVVRARGGGRWQFRHDQMRAYLAARWAAREAVLPERLFEETPAIWRLGRSEQQVVWEFFARMLDEAANRRVLAWADEEADRAELQVALRRAWRSRVVGWRPPRRGPAEAPGG